MPLTTVDAPAAYWIRNETRTWAPRPYRLDDGRIDWSPLSADRTFPIPPRVYLGPLRRLDLSNENEILGFCRRFGVLGAAHHSNVIPDRSPISAAAPGDWTAKTARPIGNRTFEQVDEFGWLAALIRSLTTIYHLHQTGGLDEWSGSPTGWDGKWISPPSSAREARTFFTTWMNTLLEPFTPRVSFTTGDGSDGPAPSEGLARRTLFNAMVVQLFNDLVTSVTYNICASETCRQLFVDRSDGTVGSRHHSSGVLYCSAGCARAQAQRAYRRRRIET